MLRTFFIILVTVNLLQTVVMAVDTPINCITCDSSTDQTCSTNPSTLTSQNCDSGSCYTKIAQGVVTRGCIDGVTTEDTCTADANCVTCSTGNCNGDQTICQKCNSNTDPLCAQMTSTNSTFNTVCPILKSQCYVGLDGVNTERRCATDQDITCANCKLCDGSNCNNMSYPSDRLMCYQCQSSATETTCNNPIAQGTSANALACVNYVVDDKCYTYGTSATAMQRGCVSDTVSNVCAATKPDAACATCSSNACNSRQYTYQPSLQCIQCNSKDQANCAEEQKVSAATNCDPILYTGIEKCYSQVKDGVITRGCGECTDSNGCQTCNTPNGCNNAVLDISINCIECRTDIETKCLKDSVNLTSVTCENSLCYGIKWENIIVRGCLANAVPEVKLICSDTKQTQCITCNKDKCNVQPSDAGMKTINTGLLIFVAVATLFKRFI